MICHESRRETNKWQLQTNKKHSDGRRGARVTLGRLPKLIWEVVRKTGWCSERQKHEWELAREGQNGRVLEGRDRWLPGVHVFQGGRGCWSVTVRAAGWRGLAGIGSRKGVVYDLGLHPLSPGACFNVTAAHRVCDLSLSWLKVAQGPLPRDGLYHTIWNVEGGILLEVIKSCFSKWRNQIPDKIGPWMPCSRPLV